MMMQGEVMLLILFEEFSYIFPSGTKRCVQFNSVKCKLLQKCLSGLFLSLCVCGS